MDFSPGSSITRCSYLSSFTFSPGIDFSKTLKPVHNNSFLDVYLPLPTIELQSDHLEESIPEKTYPFEGF